jgi:hypothetical protein
MERTQEPMVINVPGTTPLHTFYMATSSLHPLAETPVFLSEPQALHSWSPSPPPATGSRHPLAQGPRPSPCTLPTSPPALRSYSPIFYAINPLISCRDCRDSHNKSPWLIPPRPPQDHATHTQYPSTTPPTRAPPRLRTRRRTQWTPRAHMLWSPRPCFRGTRLTSRKRTYRRPHPTTTTGPPPKSRHSPPC